MGILDRLFRKRHPSDRWMLEVDVPLVLDLSSQSICNVGLGQPIEWLSVLGPPEDSRQVHWECYCYYSKGFEIEAEGGLVSGITVVWCDDLRKEFDAFYGQVAYKGRKVEVSSDAAEEYFVSIFGDPFHRDEDDQEILLFYEIRREVEWQVEFTREGLLKAMYITSEPLLGNSSQREAYSVKKSWPPDYG